MRNSLDPAPTYLVQVLASSVLEGHLEDLHFLHGGQRVIVAWGSGLAHEAVLDVEEDLPKHVTTKTENLIQQVSPQ